jgi:two-component system chemotaxis response regulator CheB
VTPAVAQPQIRILVVDDSAFMRKAISMMLESDPQIKVVGTARNGEEGIEKVRLLKPDLVTMDIEMPGMDGLTALREIMKKHPVPVMMVSSITTEGAQATLEALELGAVDFIPKQMSYVSLDIVKIKEELIAKIKDITRRKHVLLGRLRRRLGAGAGGPATPSETAGAGATSPHYAAPLPGSRRQHHVDIIAIGSSTGGPPALQEVLPKLPANLPVGVLVAQHMPPTFTKSLAERLNSLSEVSVQEARDGDRIEPGLVLIAPGGKHIIAHRAGGATRARVSDEPVDTLYHPCVDVLIDSVAKGFGGSSLAVILTGMGTNGMVGSRELRQRGGKIIAQDEASSVVYGMPRAVIEAGLADHVAPVDCIAQEILSYF